MSTNPAVPVVARPGEGTTVQGPAGGPLTFKLRGEQSGGRFTAVENVVAPGEGPPVHIHEVEDEAWFIIEGTLAFDLGGETAEAPEGTFVFVPRGTPHAFRNVGGAPARILVMFTPSGMERFFDRFAELPDGAEIAPAFAEIGGDVGMKVVGPPLV